MRSEGSSHIGGRRKEEGGIRRMWRVPSILPPSSFRLTDSRQFLEQPPVLQSVLHSCQQRRRRIAVLIEVLGEAALAAGEVDERHLLLRLGVDVPVVLYGWVALQRQPLLHLVALTWVVDQDREGPGIDGQTGLLAGHVVGDAMLGLAGR